jgi:hypothetical protein
MTSFVARKERSVDATPPTCFRAGADLEEVFVGNISAVA